MRQIIKFGQKLAYLNKMMLDRILPPILIFYLLFFYAAISLILKTKSNRECSMNAVKSLMAIVKFDVIFKNVFREVGMLEALIECLKKYTEVMKSSSDVKDEIDMKLGEAVINALNDLIFGNSQNAIV